MGRLYSFYCGPGEEFIDGIFTKIRSITKEHLITESTIEFDVSTYDSSYPPENVLRKNTATESTYWRSQGTTNDKEWFSINFKRNRIKLESVHLLTYDVDIVETYKFYGSNDNDEELIAVFPDSKPEQTTRVPVQLTFNITDWKTRNKIRIEKDGRRTLNNDKRFVIHDLELIGSFFVPLIACSGRVVFHHYYLYLYLFLS